MCGGESPVTERLCFNKEFGCNGKREFYNAERTRVVGARGLPGGARRPRPGGRAIFGSRGIWGWVLGALGVCALVGAALTLAGRADPGAFGEERAALGPGHGLVVSTTPLGDNEVVICLVDTLHQRLVVYLADARRSRLKLLAVRDISADGSLSDYNNDPPLPKDIRTRVEKGAESGKPAPASAARKNEASP